MTENPAPVERGEHPGGRSGGWPLLGSPPLAPSACTRPRERLAALEEDPRWPGLRERLGRLRDAPAPPGRVTYQRPGAGSTHAAGDVSLGALVGRVLEDLLGAAVLNEHARAGVVLTVGEHGEEGGAVTDPRGLLHVVRDDEDRVPRLELPHQVLDPGCRDGVQC